MNIIPICFFFNHKIVIPAGVCITTLLKSAKRETFYDIYVFHPGDLNDELKNTLIQLQKNYPNCKLNFLDVSNEFTNGYILRGIPNVTYYRLLVPEYLPQYDKAIVSDVDIIFNIDLSDLYNLNLDGYYIAAVKNAIVKKKYVKSLGCDPYKYVNCGFFVYNSSEIRKKNISAHFRDLVGNKYFYLDQDIINIVCKDKIKYISPKYNITQSFYQRYYNDPDYLELLFTKEELADGINASVISKNIVDEINENIDCVIHYNGVNPWETFCWRFDLWWECYRSSIYFDREYYYKQYDKILKPELNKLLKNLVRGILKKYFGKLKNRLFPT